MSRLLEETIENASHADKAKCENHFKFPRKICSRTRQTIGDRNEKNQYLTDVRPKGSLSRAFPFFAAFVVLGCASRKGDGTKNNRGGKRFNYVYFIAPKIFERRQKPRERFHELLDTLFYVCVDLSPRRLRETTEKEYERKEK